MSKNDGGPAFPQIETEAAESNMGSQQYSHVYSYGGMSLRDYFAAQALAGLCAACGPEYRPTFFLDMDGFAKDAYGMADAMLAEREK